MAEEPKPKRAINPDDPDLTELEQALGYAIGAVEVHLKAQKRLLKVLCEMPEGPERDAQAKQFKEIFKETRALPPRPWGQRTRFLEDLFELLCLSISFWTLRHLAEHFQQSLLRFQVNFYCSNCVAEGLLQLSQVWVVWIDSAFGLWLLSHQQSIVATQR